MEILLARIQFAATSTYHFFFVPLTLGLVLLVAIIQTRYVQTGDEKFKKMTKFWGNLFLINFAMGVVTGIVQEFQFGMNWSGYSRYVGDIFGAPLAVEALLAFFIESTFIGIWVFGWERLGKKAHLTCIWLVAIASNLSAVWILIANSFMQNPVGYDIVNGRAQMIDFPALITNPHFLYQFPHVFSAGLCTGAFFIMGVSAWHLFKGSDIDFFKTSFKYGATAGFIAVILVVGIGHFQGQHLVQEQPMKMAAAEAHWETSDPADFVVFAGIDEKGRANSAEVKIPGLLSFMSYNSFTGEVKGLNDLQAEMEALHGPGNYTPPVAVNFWSFRVMVGAGLLMMLLALLALIFRGKIETKKGFLRVMPIALFLPYLANTGGWFLAEFGRQPWLVYNLQTLEEGVSTVVPASSIVISLVGLVLIYTLLMIADIYLLAAGARKSPELLDAPEGKEGSLWI
ncbi:MAG: cytochrome ubiquinol oxidase subunit I [Gracilibacteraceae bacterium]|jgi:cytochrome d ubiquinol oxidase subunit I|nr:cytochrome ubiquinol oxidase subunit I [Gracilibacteraceae bacterium]